MEIGPVLAHRPVAAPSNAAAGGFDCGGDEDLVPISRPGVGREALGVSGERVTGIAVVTSGRPEALKEGGLA